MGIKKIATVGNGLHGSSIATTSALTEGRKVAVIDNKPEPLTYRITEQRAIEPSIVIPPPYIRTSKKVYPNDPCTCGSGKKFKKCCNGKNKVRSDTGPT